MLVSCNMCLAHTASLSPLPSHRWGGCLLHRLIATAAVAVKTSCNACAIPSATAAGCAMLVAQSIATVEIINAVTECPAAARYMLLRLLPAATTFQNERELVENKSKLSGAWARRRRLMRHRRLTAPEWRQTASRARAAAPRSTAPPRGPPPAPLRAARLSAPAAAGCCSRTAGATTRAAAPACRLCGAPPSAPAGTCAATHGSVAVLRICSTMSDVRWRRSSTQRGGLAAWIPTPANVPQREYGMVCKVQCCKQMTPE